MDQAFKTKAKYFEQLSYMLFIYYVIADINLPFTIKLRVCIICVNVFFNRMLPRFDIQKLNVAIDIVDAMAGYTVAVCKDFFMCIISFCACSKQLLATSVEWSNFSRNFVTMSLSVTRKLICSTGKLVRSSARYGATVAPGSVAFCNELRAATSQTRTRSLWHMCRADDKKFPALRTCNCRSIHTEGNCLRQFFKTYQKEMVLRISQSSDVMLFRYERRWIISICLCRWITWHQPQFQIFESMLAREMLIDLSSLNSCYISKHERCTEMSKVV